jgi:hypothetical protein
MQKVWAWVKGYTPPGMKLWSTQQMSYG